MLGSKPKSVPAASVFKNVSKSKLSKISGLSRALKSRLKGVFYSGISKLQQKQPKKKNRETYISHAHISGEWLRLVWCRLNHRRRGRSRCLLRWCVCVCIGSTLEGVSGRMRRDWSGRVRRLRRVGGLSRRGSSGSLALLVASLRLILLVSLLGRRLGRWLRSRWRITASRRLLGTAGVTSSGRRCLRWRHVASFLRRTNLRLSRRRMLWHLSWRPLTTRNAVSSIGRNWLAHLGTAKGRVGAWGSHVGPALSREELSCHIRHLTVEVHRSW